MISLMLQMGYFTVVYSEKFGIVFKSESVKPWLGEIASAHIRPKALDSLEINGPTYILKGKHLLTALLSWGLQHFQRF